MRILWDKKNKVCKGIGKLGLPPGRGGEFSVSDIGRYAGKAGKKAAEMGRFFASEWLREPAAQQMLMRKAEPFLKSGINQLSTAIRPKKAYKTNRKDLDGSGLLSNMAYGFNYAPWTRPPQGKGLDIHKFIGKLPKPKKGWTPGNYKYMGPYNPLDKQLEYDPESGEVLKWNVKPLNRVDEISAHHDICYGMAEDGKRTKKECDKRMVQQLDDIPYGEMPKWGQVARFLINTKQKLGMGLGNERRF